VEPMTYTVEEVCRLLRMGRNQCYEAIRRGDIPALRIGRRFLVPRAALDRMLDIAPSRSAEAGQAVA
jgi:excisionase family DNA binding protein